ncbi:DUF1648 domain-containing protein [Nocardioides sp. Y6]|uniref:DUF1648 domain-containing protein n=1 Tax=Nocardioides malaquae TaxID=2773426 RepID=A0ABR9RW32_9ACTN|nr:DUF1648 domain-containing protein [Nocardioides malaquae]MBE7325382.1 DUF1648 domain-containing protein [Nocardioides malaquae]
MSLPARWNLSALLLALGSFALAWFALPDGEIAVHFGVDGQPDEWGTRTELVAVVGGLCLATWLFLAWMSHSADRLHWSMVNIPRKDHWAKPEHEPVARRRLAEDMALVNLWTMGLLVSICPVMVLSARRGELTGPLAWSVWILIGAFCLALVAMMRHRNRFYRDVPEA